MRAAISTAVAIAIALVTSTSAQAESPPLPESQQLPPWPPPLESLSDGESCAERPACDVDAPDDASTLAFRDADRFERVLNTTATDCASFVAVTDPRARLGNVATEPMGVRFRGSCVLSPEGEVIGAIRGGILATCQETPQPFGATALETAIVELSSAGSVPASGDGKARVPVVGLPWLLVGQSACEIAIDVRIRERAVGGDDPSKVSAAP